MKIQDLQVGMKIMHPQYGEGIVQSVSNVDASILFGNVLRTIDPDLAETAPAEATFLAETGPEAPTEPASAEPSTHSAQTGDDSSMPLRRLIESTLDRVLQTVGVENPADVLEELGARWQKGKLLLQPSDPSEPAREIPLEVFFHKIVGVRDELRVLERKIDASEKLSSADKFDLQQYIARSHGTMTTFNILFRNKEDQFSSKGE